VAAVRGKELFLDEVQSKILAYGNNPNKTEWSDHAGVLLDRTARREVFRPIRLAERNRPSADVGTRPGTDSGISAVGRGDSGKRLRIRCKRAAQISFSFFRGGFPPAQSLKSVYKGIIFRYRNEPFSVINIRNFFKGHLLATPNLTRVSFGGTSKLKPFSIKNSFLAIFTTTPT